MVKKLVLLVILALVTVHTVSATKCYLCDGKDECKKQTGNKTNLKVCETEEFEFDTTTETTSSEASTLPEETSLSTENPSSSTEKQEELENPESKQNNLLFYNIFQKFLVKADVDNDFRCYSISKGDTYKKGCTKRSCTTIKELNLADNCNVCEADGCNSASKIQNVVINSIILVVISKLFF